MWILDRRLPSGPVQGRALLAADEAQARREGVEGASQDEGGIRAAEGGTCWGSKWTLMFWYGSLALCKTARLLEAGWRTSVPALLYDYWLLLDHGCHGDVLVGNLQRLRSNESYNDVQFSLRDGTVHANSVIMSMGSEHFSTMTKDTSITKNIHSIFN